jgi:hypothetical protein
MTSCEDGIVSDLKTYFCSREDSNTCLSQSKLDARRVVGHWDSRRNRAYELEICETADTCSTQVLNYRAGNASAGQGKVEVEVKR